VLDRSLKHRDALFQHLRNRWQDLFGLKLEVLLYELLTPRQALDQLAGIQMLDVELPTTGGRKLTLRRYTQPDTATGLLLQRLGRELPGQSPPKLSSPMKMKVPQGALALTGMDPSILI